MPGTEGGGVRGCRVFIFLLVDIIDDTGTNLAVFHGTCTYIYISCAISMQSRIRASTHTLCS